MNEAGSLEALLIKRRKTGKKSSLFAPSFARMFSVREFTEAWMCDRSVWDVLFTLFAI